MSLFIQNRKTMFDIVKEADEDTANDIIDGSIDNNQANDNAGGDNPPPANNDQTNDNNDNAGDDDINIDASLKGLDNIGDDADNNTDTGEDNTNTDTTSDTSSTTSSGGSDGEEPIQKNTDIFANLTAEEQTIKIMELKKLYNDLYTSTDDILDRINNLSSDNINIDVLSRITHAMYALKVYIKDYIEKSFGIKSYIENDCKYNEFLYVYNSIASILEDIIATNKKADKN